MTKRFMHESAARITAVGAVTLAMAGCGTATVDTGSTSGAIQANCNLLSHDSQDFASGVGLWTSWYSASIARSTAASKQSSASLLVTVTDPYGWGITMNDWPGIVASPGAVGVSFWAKHAAGSALSPTLELHWRDASNNDIRVDKITISDVTNTWREGKLATSAPAGTEHVGVDIVGSSGSPGDAFYLDQVFVTETSCTGKDGGTPPSDSGPAKDAGSPPKDAGSPPADAGPPPPPSDSGSVCTSPVWSSSSAEGTESFDSTGLWWVNNDAWNGSHGPQTIEACSQTSWNAVSNQPNVGGAVETYPDTEYDIGGRDEGLPTKTVGEYKSITSTFSEDFPSAGSWDAAYDLWLNNWGIEIMIWNEWTGTQLYYPPPGSQALTLDGVPYHYYQNGSENMFFRDTMIKSGSVDILAAMNWLVSEGTISSTDVPTQLEYGVEICSTSGTETFPMTGVTFSLE